MLSAILKTIPLTVTSLFMISQISWANRAFQCETTLNQQGDSPEVELVINELADLALSQHSALSNGSKNETDLKTLLSETLIAEKKLTLKKTFGEIKMNSILLGVRKRISEKLRVEEEITKARSDDRIEPKAFAVTYRHFNPKQILEIKTPSLISSVSYSPDGREILTAAAQDPGTNIGQFTLDIWDAKTGAKLREFAVHSDHVSSARFSQDQKLIITASWDGTIKVWNSHTGELQVDLTDYNLRSLSFFKLFVSPLKQNDARFSLDSKRAISSSGGPSQSVWDVSTAKRLFKLKGHPTGVSTAFFSHKGDEIVTAGIDGQIVLWDARNGKEIRHLHFRPRGGRSFTVTTAAFSSDDRQLVTALSSGSVVIWDRNTDQQRYISFRRQWFNSAQFFRESSNFMLTSDRNIRIWNSENHELLFESPRSDYSISSAEISPDQEHIVFVESDTFHVLSLYDKGDLKLDEQ